MYSEQNLAIADKFVENLNKFQKSVQGIDLECGEDDIVWIEVGDEHFLADQKAYLDPKMCTPEYIKSKGLFQYIIETSLEFDEIGAPDLKIVVVLIDKPDE